MPLATTSGPAILTICPCLLIGFKPSFRSVLPPNRSILAGGTQDVRADGAFHRAVQLPVPDAEHAVLRRDRDHRDLRQIEILGDLLRNFTCELFCDIDDRMVRLGKPVQRATASKIARGSMVRWMAENGIERPEDLVRFDIGYAYAPELSSEDGRTLVFMKRA